MANRWHVLVVDDDYYAREAMRLLLSKDGRTSVWDVVASVPEAVHALEERGSRQPPEVMLLDVRLQEGERAGIEGIPALRAAAPSAKVLVTSVDRDEDTILSATEAGADGYVYKNETTDGIATAIAHVAEGRFVVSPSVAERMLGMTVDLSDYAAKILPQGDHRHDLTERLRKTAHLYAVCGMSAREVAEELAISAETVNSRIRIIYHVLNATSRQEAFQRLVSREFE